MGVNLSVFVRFYIREQDRRLTNLAPPLLGSAICLFVWLHLGWQAKLAGSIWILAGILYGAIKTKGFRFHLVDFNFPTDETP